MTGLRVGEAFCLLARFTDLIHHIGKCACGLRGRSYDLPYGFPLAEGVVKSALSCSLPRISTVPGKCKSTECRAGPLQCTGESHIIRSKIRVLVNIINRVGAHRSGPQEGWTMIL